MSTKTTGELHLIGHSGHSEDIKEANGNISATNGYKQAYVKESDPKSLWVVYTVPSWDHGVSPDDNSSTIVYPDNNEHNPVTTKSPIQSAQGFDMENPGAILFEHSQFRGYGNKTTSSVEDLTTFFPQGTTSGVSSAFITGGIWNLFTDINFGGNMLSIDGVRDFGPGQHDFGSLAVKDQAKSIKYVKASS